jgi:hypothetical protein
MYAKQSVASDHKPSNNTYVSPRISSLDTERKVGQPLVKTFLKQRFRSAWLHYVSGHFEDI